VWEASGGHKEILKEEQPTIDFAYATVVTIADISAGDVFTRENIWVKRPGTGEIKAEEYDSIIGKRATRDLKRDVHVRRSDIV